MSNCLTSTISPETTGLNAATKGIFAAHKNLVEFCRHERDGEQVDVALLRQTLDMLRANVLLLEQVVEGLGDS